MPTTTNYIWDEEISHLRCHSSSPLSILAFWGAPAARAVAEWGY
jgi:hypothetical protein